MIWYILAFFVGLIFFKNKYKLSTWTAFGWGLLAAFGIYFTINTLGLMLFGIMSGLGNDEVLVFVFSFLLSSFIAFSCFRGLSKLIKKEKLKAQ